MDSSVKGETDDVDNAESKVHSRMIEKQPDLPNLGPQERGRVVDVSHRLGTPNVPPPEWLLSTPLDKVPKPEREAFPPPPRNEDGDLSPKHPMDLEENTVRLTPSIARASPTILRKRGYEQQNIVEIKEIRNSEENEEIDVVEEAEHIEMKIEKRSNETDENHDHKNPNWEFMKLIREYRNQLDYKPISITDPIQPLQICVAVRKRPMNKKEVADKEVDILSIPNTKHIVLHEPKVKCCLTKYLRSKDFLFDYVFDVNIDIDIVYRFTARPLVETLFGGGMSTFFTYGQTGSGKTYTMLGDISSPQGCKGIYALTAEEVFNQLNFQFKDEGFVVTCSFFEIYNGKVLDLMSNKKELHVGEDENHQFKIIGLREKQVNCVEDVLVIIKDCNAVRRSSQTAGNRNSSRSHAVFQIVLKRPTGLNHGKFYLIDLAGSERSADTSSANSQTRKEGAEINKSLLALNDCIRALGKKSTYVPFRRSTLTQVLKESFTCENSRTCMIVTISPTMSSCQNSLNSLEYAKMVKELGQDMNAECKGAHQPVKEVLYFTPKEKAEAKKIFKDYVDDTAKEYKMAAQKNSTEQQHIVDVSNLEQERRRTNAFFSEVIASYEEKCKDLMAHKIEVGALQNEISSLKNKCKSKDLLLQAEKKKVLLQKDDIEELIQKLSEKDCTISTLEEKVRQCEVEKERLIQENGHIQQTLKDEINDIKSANSRFLTKLERHVKDFKKEINQLQLQLKKIEEENVSREGMSEENPTCNIM